MYILTKIVISEENKRFRICFRIQSKSWMRLFFLTVELHRFRKELHECVSLVDKWCYSLKHVGSLDRLPEELRVRAFERLFEACEIAKFTPEEKLRYEHERA